MLLSTLSLSMAMLLVRTHASTASRASVVMARPSLGSVSVSSWS